MSNGGNGPLGSCGVLVMAVACAMSLPAPSAAQPEPTADERWAPPQTPWGDPDLQGIWDYRSITPLQRPDGLADRPSLSEEEAAEFEQDTVSRRHKDRRPEDGITVATDVANAYNHFWWDYGDKLTEGTRTSLIVDPADGRIPALTPDGERRAELRRQRRDRPAYGPEDRNPWERCIVGGNAGPPMNPGAYNNNFQVLQTPGQVVILTEMIHDVRIIRLDARPHIPDRVRQWRGDSRGRWDGDTLVVETTNFTDKTTFRGSGPSLRVVERFTRVDADIVRYEYTIDDPASFTQTWTAVVHVKRTDGPMFEYACHEGNYGMVNLLAGARAADKAAKDLSTNQPPR